MGALPLRGEPANPGIRTHIVSRLAAGDHQPEHGRACGAMLQHGRTDVGLTRGSDLITAVSELL